MQIEHIYTLFQEHPVVTTDSRNIPANALFFALKGEHFNGNSFASSALEQGAAYAIVDEPQAMVSEKCILVEDVLTTLQQLAHHHRLQFSIPILAITGTNGKTTTKELVSAVLAQKYSILATKGNLNNHIGVPLTLLQIRENTEIAVIEMGANHPGEIDLLCRIAEPTHGMITNVGKAHLEGFGGFEGVVKTKTELYRFLHEKQGSVFINSGNTLLMQHAEHLEKVTYGLYSDAQVSGKLIGDSGFVSLQIQSEKINLEIKSNLFGKYNAENMLAAVAVGVHFQVSSEQIKLAIENYHPTNNRSQIKLTEKNTLILDAYNANPSSMKEALEHFASTNYPEKMVVLGDMRELGEESEQEHLQILDLVKRLKFEEVYLVGPEMTRLCTEIDWRCFQDSELARWWFEFHRPTGKTILIKGSRGIQLERIVDFL